MRLLNGLLWLLILVLMVPPSVDAQRRTVVVRVRVVDTASVPVPGASIAIMRGLRETLAQGETDVSGIRSFPVDSAGGSHEVVVRKIGYVRANQFFIARNDTVAITITMHRATQTLAPVAVTAREDIKRKAYHVDADEIANAKQVIVDGLDVLRKLKPDILTGRIPGCGLEEVWVNGMRVIMPIVRDMAVARRGLPSRLRPPSGRSMPAQRFSNVGDEVWSIMSTIKSEHIDEMNYEDCFSTTVVRSHATQALFVVLKPGIGFEPGIGSYVVSDTASLREVIAEPARAVSSSQSFPSYRLRVLGVFDEKTGDALEGAIVTDTLSGTSARTTATGTVSLVFLPDGVSGVRVAKPGYGEVRLDVAISPRDTLPVTVMLAPKP